MIRSVVLDGFRLLCGVGSLMTSRCTERCYVHSRRFCQMCVATIITDGNAAKSQEASKVAVTSNCIFCIVL
jgi:hypothetical protein